MTWLISIGIVMSMVGIVALLFFIPWWIVARFYTEHENAMDFFVLLFVLSVMVVLVHNKIERENLFQPSTTEETSNR